MLVRNIYIRFHSSRVKCFTVYEEATNAVSAFILSVFAEVYKRPVRKQ